MKKLYLYSFFALFAFSVTSCKKDSFLSATQTSNLTEQTVFTDSLRTLGFLSDIYSNIGISFSPSRFGNGGLDAASDESQVYNNNGSNAFAFATGIINSTTVSADLYNTCYASIRKVNQLLKNLPRAPINAAIKTRTKAEARFLRAWYYAMLLKHYAGIPLVGDTLYTNESYIPAKRNTYAECVNYITAECDAAAQDLNVVQTSIEYGRASKAACKALKARVLLYAASPLFNPPPDDADPIDYTKSDGGNAKPGRPYTAEDNALVRYTNYDAKRWQLAAMAADSIIESKVFSLYTGTVSNVSNSFQSLFLQRGSSEHIFALLRGGNKEFESLWNPPSRGGGGGGYPLQGLVDAFPMANGLPITDPASGYDPNNPYKGRDPRLEYTVIHDQSQLVGNALGTAPYPVNIYTGTYNGVKQGQDAVFSATSTGYYTNKMLDPRIVAGGFFYSIDRSWPLMRYAEVLLNYAEAANEFYGPTALVKQRVELIRQRAGLNPYQLPDGLTKEAMRTIIRNERRIELAFEEHRFWDVRRWKIAQQTDNIQAMGMEVNRNDNAVTYKPFVVNKRNFRRAMYLWPFPQNEVNKSPLFLQNPGY